MSWDADKFLVRTQDDRGFNLSIGEPYIVQDAFAAYYPTNIAPPILLRLGYPLSEPEPELMDELKRLHPGKHIVVTNGAKQALHAGVYALRANEYRHGIRHRLPCWPTHASVARMADTPFNEQFTPTPADIVINTSPNNPDGTESDEPCDIWDAAYATETYGWAGMQPKHRLSVWSSAKMLGTSGARVGWLVTEEPELAKQASAYVEMTTSGVSINGQLFVAGTLRLARGHLDVLFRRARHPLIENAQEFLRLRNHLKLFAGTPVNLSGMFAWFQVDDTAKWDRALAKSGVRLLPGWACYGPQDYYRMSLGQRPHVIRNAIDTLLTELESQ